VVALYALIQVPSAGGMLLYRTIPVCGLEVNYVGMPDSVGHFIFG